MNYLLFREKALLTMHCAILGVFSQQKCVLFPELGRLHPFTGLVSENASLSLSDPFFSFVQTVIVTAVVDEYRPGPSCSKSG